MKTNYKSALLIDCLLFLLFCFAMSLTSCKTLEQKCSDRFPSEVTEVVTETLRTDTIITPWNTVEYLDTTICLPDVDTNMVIKTVYKRLPPDTIYHDVVCMDTMVVYADQAKVNWLTSQLQAQAVISDDAKKSRRRMMLGLMGVSAAAAIFMILWIVGLIKK